MRQILFFLLFYSLNAFPQAYSDYLGAGHFVDIKIYSSHENANNPAKASINGMGLYSSEPNVNSRFFAQSSFGESYSNIDNFTNNQEGITYWIENQYQKEPSLHYDYLDYLLTEFYPQNVPGFNCFDEPYFRVFAWWQMAMSDQDPLRQKVAMALSEIFVVSDQSSMNVDNPRMPTSYYDVLLRNAFGNFRDLLEEMTLHPAMGTYLSHLHNKKTDLTINRYPDENFAREIMQLFTIGLYELNQDGSYKLNENGDSIRTYNNNDIKEFAKVFTGLMYDTSEVYQNQPMLPNEEDHEPGEKKLLNGTTIPPGQNTLKDISDALDNLFEHPNVGPFIAKLLIQRLVTSNPSPEYIYRVAAAFNDNGSEQRGDLKAVISAILLDPEARNCKYQDDPNYGKQREPYLRYVQLCRAFNARNDAGTFHNFWKSLKNDLGQVPLSAPSVFNFFLPNYQANGPIKDNDLVSPEFQITNDVTAITSINVMVDAILLDQLMKRPFENYGSCDANEEIPMLDLSQEEALANNPDVLIDRLDLILTYGTLSDQTRDIIRNTIIQLDSSERVKMALFLFMVSPEFVIQR